MTRRTFFAGLGCGGFALMASEPRIEYRTSADCIEVWRRGRRMQSVTSEKPSFVTLDRGRLFVVNEIDEYEGLPTGSVESYSVETGTGLLSFLSRQKLSLSAIFPRHLAISPDGRHLVVAVYGGGAYNVLPVRADGTIGSVTQVVKEIGGGAHSEKQRTAHPSAVAFHPSGKFVVGSDFGSDRINVFSFQEGQLSRLRRIATPAGSGPIAVDFDASGMNLHVQHGLIPLRSRYRFEIG